MYISVNGDVYRGEAKDDLMHGYGECTLANGDKYEGEYKYGEKEGYGKYTYPDGKIEEGIFEDNRFMKNALKDLMDLIGF